MDDEDYDPEGNYSDEDEEPDDEGDDEANRVIRFSMGEGEEEEEDEIEIEEDESDGLTANERRIYSSIPKDLPVIKNGSVSYIVVDKDVLKKYPDILSCECLILLKWIDPSITHPFLNRFEASRLIEMRCEEFAAGEKSTIDVGDLTESFDIAEQELLQRRLPAFIKRPRNNGNKLFYLIDPNDVNTLGLPLFNRDYL